MTSHESAVGEAAAPQEQSRLHADFYKLWAGLSASLAGSRITALAIPLIAAVEVGVSPLQMGALAAVGEGAYVLVSLPIGLHIDHVHRRPIMIATDLGCALTLLTIPLAFALGQVTFLHLALVAGLVGLLSASGEIAQMAYIPSLVGKGTLVAANSRIQLSHSVAESAGPGLGGLLIQVLTAPLAILTDVFSYLCSALLTLRITRPEAALPRRREMSAREALGEGFTALFGHPLLRPIMWTSIGSALFSGGVLSMFVLFATRDLGLNALTIGGIFALGGVFAVPGAMLANAAGRRFGVGPTIVWGWIIEAASWLIIPFVAGPLAVMCLLLGLSRATEGLTGAMANIHQWTLRQSVTPDRLQGRVTAIHRFLVYGAGALGALLGGVLGTVFDLRLAILLCAMGALAARAMAAGSALRAHRG